MAPPKKAAGVGRKGTRAVESKRGPAADRLERASVLAAWAIGQLGFDDWEPLKAALEPAEKLSWTAGGQSPYVAALLKVPRRLEGALGEAELRRIDARILDLTHKMNERRTSEPVHWKYFQYLALLWSDLYLDRLLSDREGLRRELNDFLYTFNSKNELALPQYQTAEENEARAEAPVPGKRAPFFADDLDKLAIWQATGSGKTLLLHAHVYQYREALDRHGLPPVERVMLITPNIALSEQHIAELRLSGLHGAPYLKSQQALDRPAEILVMEITSFREDEKENTVSVSRFEGHNLVLVDEGHRGSGDAAGAWRSFRAALARKGFCIEYSATFGQAVEKNDELLNEYARCILINYAFRRFHHDGYGKHYRILNLRGEARKKMAAEADIAGEDNGARESLTLRRYLTGALASLLQQLFVWAEHTALTRRYKLEKPLCIFVGASVTGSGDESAEDTDILKVIRVLAMLLSPSERETNLAILRDLLAGKLGFLVEREHGPVDLFAPSIALAELTARWPSVDILYGALLQQVFNTPAPSRLHLAEIKEAPGEIALWAGTVEKEPFAVINVGDPARLRKRCEERLGSLIDVQPKAIGGSLFQGIKDPQSPVKLLIGSRKFSEGWSSWRVSMMGLLNLGRNPGTQIIQLFGRGVRLKGEGLSLKRSSPNRVPNAGTDMSRLRVLETFTVFGIHADYMDKFDEMLQANGVPGVEPEEEQELPEVRLRLPTVRVKKLPSLVLVLPPERGFHRSDTLAFLSLDPTVFQGSPIEVDAYPRMQATSSTPLAQELLVLKERDGHPGPLPCFAFVDHDKLYDALVRLRDEKGWVNLRLPRFLPDPRPGARPGAEVPLTLALLAGSWYRIEAPDTLIHLNNGDSLPFKRRPIWQQIARELVERYTFRVYESQKRRYETLNMRMVDLSTLDEKGLQHFLPGAHEITLINATPGSDLGLVQWVNALAAKVVKGVFDDRHDLLESVGPAVHLYRPILHQPGPSPRPGARLPSEITLRTRPLTLDKEELRFVRDVQRYVESRPLALEGAVVHLLRNEFHKREGSGFAITGGRYFPDFMLWVLRGDRQHLTFVDTKGLMHLGSADGQDKLDLHKLLREVEERNRDLRPDVYLDAWIVSTTPIASAPPGLNLHSVVGARARHVVFPEPAGGLAHIDLLVRAAVAGAFLSVTPGVCGGVRCIRDTRIPVWTIASLRSQGATDLELLADFPTISREQLFAADDWFRLFPEEIQADLRAQEEA